MFLKQDEIQKKIDISSLIHGFCLFEINQLKESLIKINYS